MHSRILGEGRPLVILHGFLGTSDNWLRLAKVWAQSGYRVHLVDLRNHGRSFWDDEFNFEVLTEDLHRYITFHQLKTPHLLGHSLGGKIIMFDAVQNPGNRGKYIVVDIAPKSYPPHHQYIFDAIRKINPKGLGSRNEAQEILARAIKDPFLAGFLLKSLKRTGSGFRWSHNWDVLEENMEEVGQALPPYKVSEKPFLFVRGKKSPYITPEDYPLIKAHFPRSSVLEIAEAGHLVHLDAPEQLAAAVTNFLR